jgi:hypothetical protein
MIMEPANRKPEVARVAVEVLGHPTTREQQKFARASSAASLITLGYIVFIPVGGFFGGT